ncbi:MAG TPA: preprotein translocase subunit YajC [Campylobacterales bacterium]|nr:preprotein translocase subunit YajC [Campylobacterales bacterium]HIO70696.1 preprotein translocase subunit YajC [Campylobacterales bacterium]
MEQTAGQGSFLASILPLIVLFAIFYFLVIRPQQKQMKEHQEMVNSLTKGDKIVTNGGLIVEVVKVEPNFFKVKLNDNTEAKLDRDSVLKKYDEA